MGLLQNYNKCSLCGSKKLILQKKQYNKENFYMDAVKYDLGITNKELLKIKLYKCSNCNIVQHNPWFTNEIAFKIFNTIYGQHNRSWSNLLKFMKKGETANHGNLFNILTKKLKIKNYAEFNGPFMGLFLDFFKKENNLKIHLFKNLFDNIVKYINLRQVAGKTKNFQKNSYLKSIKFKKKINLIKKKINKNTKINKYFFYDNSTLGWNFNDNYKSVNSKVLINEMMDINLYDINNFKIKPQKFDLFGIFLTLDHTIKPKKIIDFALSSSKAVVIYAHINKKVTKQHLFSLTYEFKNYLKRKKIYNVELNQLIKKKFTSPELYLLCSKNKRIQNILN